MDTKERKLGSWYASLKPNNIYIKEKAWDQPKWVNPANKTIRILF